MTLSEILNVNKDLWIYSIFTHVIVDTTPSWLGTVGGSGEKEIITSIHKQSNDYFIETKQVKKSQMGIPTYT